MPLQLREVVERIGAVQLTGVYKTHEHIAVSGAVQRLIKECVLAVQNRFFQGTLDDVVVDRCAWLPEKEHQLWPVIQ